MSQLSLSFVSDTKKISHAITVNKMTRYNLTLFSRVYWIKCFSLSNANLIKELVSVYSLTGTFYIWSYPWVNSLGQGKGYWYIRLYIVCNRWYLKSSNTSAGVSKIGQNVVIIVTNKPKFLLSLYSPTVTARWFGTTCWNKHLTVVVCLMLHPFTARAFRSKLHMYACTCTYNWRTKWTVQINFYSSHLLLQSSQATDLTAYKQG
jgi:hypothetical protein